MKIKKGGKDQESYNQVPHRTQDTVCESEEPRGQPFPAGDHKAAMNRRQ